MDYRTFYATIRIDLACEQEITDEMLEDFSSETLYEIPDAAGLKVVDTWWCGNEY